MPFISNIRKALTQKARRIYCCALIGGASGAAFGASMGAWMGGVNIQCRQDQCYIDNAPAYDCTAIAEDDMSCPHLLSWSCPNATATANFVGTTNQCRTSIPASPASTPAFIITTSICGAVGALGGIGLGIVCSSSSEAPAAVPLLKTTPPPVDTLAVVVDGEKKSANPRSMYGAVGRAGAAGLVPLELDTPDTAPALR